MARSVILFFSLQYFICKVMSSQYNQQPIQQYLHLTGPAHMPGVTAVPIAPSFTYPQTHTAPNTPNIIQSDPKPRPVTGLSSVPGLAIPSLSLEPQKPISEKSISESKPLDQNSQNIDSILLNNLAIALQLLIVSNILNMPSDVAEMKQGMPVEVNYEMPRKTQPCYQENLIEVSKESQHYREPHYFEIQSQSLPYYFQDNPQILPNAKFLGGNYNEVNLPVKTRPSRTLMSPYEILGSNPSYSDQFLSQFEIANPKNDFKSPYAMFAETSDLFPVNM